MAETRSALQELHPHLLHEILTKNHLRAADLARLEASCYAFRATYGMIPYRVQTIPEIAAFHLCQTNSLFSLMSIQSRYHLLNRCEGNWKLVLRFLESVEQAYGCVVTPKGNIQVATGMYHTLLVWSDGRLFACGSSLSGVLGQGPDITQCRTFTPVDIPMGLPVMCVSASYQHAALVTRGGELFTYGDNSAGCCGHGDVGGMLMKPTLVAAMKGIPCKEVATGLSYTVILTRDGHVYTCGINTHGQLGHGNTLERHVPLKVQRINAVGPVVQVSAGANHTFIVNQDGKVYSFGYGVNFCLGHGNIANELQPRIIQMFEDRNIHVLRVAAGGEHSVAMDSNGQVYTWGKGYCGALGHGDENDKPTPQLVASLKDVRAVQVCAKKRKTFVLRDDGKVFAFGWMSFGSLGLTGRGNSDKVLSPHVLDTLNGQQVSQISTTLYHTILVTAKGLVLGFGDNERGQLGLDHYRSCLEPKAIDIMN